LCGQDTAETEFGKRVLGEEGGFAGFVGATWLGGVILHATEKVGFVDVKREARRVSLHAAIEEADKFGCLHLYACFLPGFTFGDGAGALVNVCPATGRRPTAILHFAYKQDALLRVKNESAHIDLGG